MCRASPTDPGTSATTAITRFFTSTSTRTPQPTARSPRPNAHRDQRQGAAESTAAVSDTLEADVKSGKLPQVSWIVAPQAYTEHPAFPPGYGAWYTAQCLNALTSNPDSWSKTALIITFDENDGFFDHVVGPYPNVGGLAGQSTVPLDNDASLKARAALPAARTASSGPTGSACACRCSLCPRGAAAKLGVLGDVRPYVPDPLHRGALRGQRAADHAVAAGRLR